MTDLCEAIWRVCSGLWRIPSPFVIIFTDETIRIASVTWILVLFSVLVTLISRSEVRRSPPGFEIVFRWRRVCKTPRLIVSFFQRFMSVSKTSVIVLFIPLPSLSRCIPSRWGLTSSHRASAPVSFQWMSTTMSVRRAAELPTPAHHHLHAALLIFPVLTMGVLLIYTLGLRLSFPSVVVVIPLSWTSLTILPPVAVLRPVRVHLLTSTPAAGKQNENPDSWQNAAFTQKILISYMRHTILSSFVFDTLKQARNMSVKTRMTHRLKCLKYFLTL